MADCTYRFAGFELDLTRLSLRGPDGTLSLRPKSFEVLRVLLEQSTRVVTKDDLMTAVWPDVTVSEESVTRCISEIRQALGDTGQRLVKTVPRRGYLLDVHVERTRNAPPAEAAKPSAVQSDRAPPLAPLPQASTRPTGVKGSERRQLTVLACSLVGSAGLSASLDPEDLQEVTDGFRAAVSNVADRHGGFAARTLGDGVVLYFGYPHAHEEDAERAVRTGLQCCSAVAALRHPGVPGGLRCRVGIATGLVVVDDDAGAGVNAAGEAPLLAQILSGQAAEGTVAISAGTRRQLGDLFDCRRLEAGAAADAFVVLRESTIASRFDALRRSSGAPLIGRVDELDTLLRLWRQASSGNGRVAQLTGEPGIGKSRLTQALSDRLAGEPLIRLQYYCSPNHADSPLHPVVVQLSEAAGLDRADPPERQLAKLEEMLGATGDAAAECVPLLAPLLSIPLGSGHQPLALNPQRRKERTFALLLGQLRALAAKKPVLMVFEDVHWIDPTTLELLTLLVEQIEGLPVLLVMTARPEFTPAWPMHSHVSMLMLGRLGPRDGEALALGMVQGRALPRELLALISSQTDGVPLFVEELTRAVLESGALEEAGARYVLRQPVPSLAVPATLHASLLARLDRLGPAKRVAQIAAVIGREFPYALLAAVADTPERDLQASLDRLVATGLVFRRGLPPDASYVFKHALVRDAAYASLLRGTRRALHEAIAARLTAHAAADAQIKPELIAHHCAEAGQVDEAVRHFLAAGAEAVARSALAESSALFEKALAQVAQLPEGRDRDLKELEVQAARGATLIAVRGYVAVETGRAYSRAKELWDRLGKPLSLVHVVRGLWLYHIIRTEYDKARPLGEEVLALSRRSKDLEGEILSLHCLGAIGTFRGELAEARATIEKAHQLYDANAHRQLFQRQPGYDPNVIGLAVMGLATALLGYPEQALAHAAESLRRARRSGRIPDLAASLEIRAKIPTLDDAAFAEGTAELQALADQHGFPYWNAQAEINKGELVLRQGRMDEAAGILQRGIEALKASGASMWSGHYARQRAVALAATGRRDDALGLLDAEIAAAERNGESWCLPDMLRQRAELLLAGDKRGRKRAEAELERALQLARTQGARLWELRIAAALARLWRDQAEPERARGLLAPIVVWFKEGHATADYEAAKALLAELKG